MDETFEEIMEREKVAILKKEAEFRLTKGKEFIIDPHGPGYVPQDIYDSEFRSPDDPDYKPKTT